ncbi:MAG: RNA polymerase sigma factor [Thermodesulfobacteriota bacterium]
MEFWTVYDAWYKPVRKFILSLVRDDWAADDLVQETFLKANLKLDQLKDQAKLKPWLFSIARRQCLDYFRQKKARRTEAEAEPDRPAAEPLAIIPMAQLGLEQGQMSRCVQDKMELLTEAHREILVLAEVMEFSLQEIAEVLNLEIGNVKVRLHRARKSLKAILDRECVFERDERSVLICLPKPLNDGQE